MTRAAIFAFAATVAAVLTASEAEARASAERGHELAQKDCAMCHAIGREGDSANAMAPPFRELHKRYPVDNLAEALAEGILTGHPQMPEFRLSPREIDDLIAYLKTLQTHRTASDAGPASQGAAGR
jgi:cytochrome c